MAKNVIFGEPVKHHKTNFAPDVVYQVSDAAAAYFIAAGWATETTAEAVMIIEADETPVDPNTVWGTGENRGEKVISA